MPLRIDVCEQLVKEIFNNSVDIVIQTLETKKEEAMVVYVDGLVDKDLVDRDILHPLKSGGFDGNVSLALKAGYKEIDDLSSFPPDVLGGNVAVFYGGSRKILLVEFRQWHQRAIAEPDAETVIRGPKEGFTESIRVNTSMIRRKIKSPNLIIEDLTLGRQTNTAIEIIYIKGIVNREVLAEVKRRLSKIDVDSILESGYIEQYISEHTFSPVSGIGITQKPDILAARILEGRVAILCDGTPHALTIPDLFIENLHTCEDYYGRPVYTSTMRILRLMGFVITVMLPGFTIAVLTYDQEMIPGVFLSTIVKSMLKTPMTVSAEIFVMTVMFELLREAGTRLPKAIGPAITIVGSLIIGQAATAAGLVSETSVIVVALTAVCGFVVTNLVEFTTVYRFLFWLLGSTMGLVGIGTGLMIMLTNLASTNSFGIPILSSFSKNERKDSFIRFPLRAMKYRPVSIAKDNIKRNDM